MQSSWRCCRLPISCAERRRASGAGSVVFALPRVFGRGGNGRALCTGPCCCVDFCEGAVVVAVAAAAAAAAAAAKSASSSRAMSSSDFGDSGTCDVSSGVPSQRILLREVLSFCWRWGRGADVLFRICARSSERLSSDASISRSRASSPPSSSLTSSLCSSKPLSEGGSPNSSAVVRRRPSHDICLRV